MEGIGGDKVREKKLDRLSSEAGAELLKARGAKGTEEELREAAEEYRGHGLALTQLGSYLADVAGGDIRRREESGPAPEEDEQASKDAQRARRPRPGLKRRSRRRWRRRTPTPVRDREVVLTRTPARD
jgi:hypothetical protein